MKYVISSGIVVENNVQKMYFVKPNYKEFAGTGIPVTTERKEAFTTESKEEIERLFETLKYNFREKPMVTEELEIVCS